MSDPALRELVVQSLRSIGGPVTFRTMGELRQKLDVDASNTQLKKAVNSLTFHGGVRASRSRSADVKLITIRLP